MMKLKFTILCISWFVADSLSGKAPFIEKCDWKDEACLKKSSQIALPYFTSGIPELGMTPLDPLIIKEVILKEKGLEAHLKDFTVTRLKECQVIDVKRDIQKELLKFTADCPVAVTGNYELSGNLLGIPIEGSGPFHVATEKLRIDVEAALTYADGKDGEKHFKIGKTEKSFDFVEKTSLVFENLFNGDKERAAPVLTIFDQSWKEMMESFGKPIADEVLNAVVAHLQKFAEGVPASDLEK